MRKRLRLTMLIGLVFAMLAATGCQFLRRHVSRTVDTPRKRWAAAEETYQMTAHSLADLAEAGKLSKDQLLTIQEYHPVVRQALDRWDRAIERGRDPGGPRAAFWSALAHLDAILEENRDATDADRNAHPSAGDAGSDDRSRAGPHLRPGGGENQGPILARRGPAGPRGRGRGGGP